jgi:hypothetical protein
MKHLYEIPSKVVVLPSKTEGPHSDSSVKGNAGCPRIHSLTNGRAAGPNLKDVSTRLFTITLVS